MSTGQPSQRLSKQPDERRDEIVAATRQLFAEIGVARVSVTEIAKRVGVTRGLIYHYFPDRDALVDLIFQDHIDEFVRAVSEWDAAREAGNVDKALLDCVAMFRHHLHTKDMFRQDLGNPENAGLYNRFVDLAVRAVVERLQVTVVKAYARAHQITIEHVGEVFYVLVYGLIGLVRSTPDVPDQVLVTIVRQTLHLERRP
jgi:AcrR family transcriptional regulator